VRTLARVKSLDVTTASMYWCARTPDNETSGNFIRLLIDADTVETDADNAVAGLWFSERLCCRRTLRNLIPSRQTVRGKPTCYCQAFLLNPLKTKRICFI
jgi:hypothetical protein